MEKQGSHGGPRVHWTLHSFWPLRILAPWDGVLPREPISMRNFDELMELRAERMALLAQLTSSDNSRRQTLNKRLMRVSKKIQKLAGIHIAPKSPAI